MCLIYKIVNEMFPDWKLYSLNSDELVFSMISKKHKSCLTEWVNLPGKDELEKIEKAVKEKLDINVRAELVFIERIPIVNCNGNKVDAYTRKNVITGETTLKKASTTFFPQIYKLSKGIDGLDIEERDLYFYAEDQICKFLEPLRLV